ncbi:MAG: hypothetical protein KatS3mg105_3799 [Gemmatales bacterium]|nr:MAG: hypothetical protein KatS3mg105_3799 [Gemmatales bacterium]
MSARLLFPLVGSVVLASGAFMLSASAPPAKNSSETARILKLFAAEFINVTPGQGKFPASFEMGSKGDFPDAEKPAHKVAFKAPFAMAKYEVTQELYHAVMGNNPSKWKGPRNSVEMVDWNEANEFCRKATLELRKRKLLGEDEIIRLPSEAEWEYVCRAGTKSAFSFGDDPNQLKDYAWFKANSKGEDPPVGMKKPNPWGFYDMHGYVWEWCLDAWHPNYQGAPNDGSAWDKKDAAKRVIRGGAWSYPAEHCRSAYRLGVPANTKNDTVGFRCVKAMAP